MPPKPVQPAVLGGPDVSYIADTPANLGVFEAQERLTRRQRIDLHGSGDRGGPAQPAVDDDGPPISERAAALSPAGGHHQAQEGL
jgi:hypothetical protein